MSEYNNIESMNNKGNITLDSPGMYLLTNNKVNETNIGIKVIFFLIVIVIGLLIVYIVAKKQYWFW